MISGATKGYWYVKEGDKGFKEHEVTDINLIAEGVETSTQADFLSKEGCSDMQGYYFYKPMPVDEFEKLDGKAGKHKK